MNLADLIKSKGLSVADAARRARLATRTVQNACAGQKTTASTTYLLSIVLQCDESDIRAAIRASKGGAS